MLRLSLVLGRSLFEIAESITADELGWYEAWYSIEPWGCRPADIRTGIQAHAAYAAMGGRASPEAFTPVWDRPRPLTMREAAPAIEAWVVANNRGTRGR